MFDWLVGCDLPETPEAWGFHVQFVFQHSIDNLNWATLSEHFWRIYMPEPVSEQVFEKNHPNNPPEKQTNKQTNPPQNT